GPEDTEEREGLPGLAADEAAGRERSVQQASRRAAACRRDDTEERPRRQRVHQGRRADVSFNVDLPLIAQDVDDVRVALPGGGAAWIDADDVDVYDVGEKPEKPSGKDLVKTAKQFDGLRYLWAGVSAYGFDCSGFTY